MIAVKHGDPLLVLVQKLGNPIADGEEHIKWRSLVILPFIIDHILEHLLINASSTHVDGYVLVVMLLSEQFCNCIYVIPVQFLNA